MNSPRLPAKQAKRPPPDPLPAYLQDTVRMEMTSVQKTPTPASLYAYRMFISLPSDDPEMGPRFIRELCFARQFVKPLKIGDKINFYFGAFAKTALREKHKKADLIIRLIRVHPEILLKTYRVVGAHVPNILLISPVDEPAEAAEKNITLARQILPPKGLFRNKYLF